MLRLKSSSLAALVLAASVGVPVRAARQTPADGHTPAPPVAAPQAPTAAPTAQTPPPQGEVLFQSHGDPPPSPLDPHAAPSASGPNPALPQTSPPKAAVHDPAVHDPAVHDPAVPDTEVTDVERSALTFTAYDLDARLMPASSGLAMRARVTVRNDGQAPLARVALHISSTLTWESASVVTAAGPVRLTLAQHLIDTDADHTGQANEALLTLAQPLAPGASTTLDTLVSGTIVASAGRLERIGATPDQAEATDWDAIGTGADSASSSAAAAPRAGTTTALRGFGNVLWYPVAAPQLFLGDGNKLFVAIAQARRRQRAATVHLRLAVEYQGEPPVAAYFCGRRQKFAALPDDPDLPVASGAGIATAEFSQQALGFRLPSLFVIEHEEMLAPTAPLLAVETSDEGAVPRLVASAQTIEPLLAQWFGARPLSVLTVLDHPGQPFEDGPLLVAPVGALGGSSSSEALAHSLTHAFVQTGQPWMDEGLAQFIALMWTEQQQGRGAALAQMTELLRPLALAEPAGSAANAAVMPAGEPLVDAADELYYRRKAAAVWWMLRDLAGEKALRLTLSAWRTRPESQHDAPTQALAFEKLLESISGKDFGWFFADWVLRDRGLPDLTIMNVTPRQLPAGNGHDTGWLVAVTVRNDGGAAVDVPLVVRSGSFSATKRLHIDGFATVTDRVLVEAPPTEVLVNDGGTPEVRTSEHSVEVVTRPSL